MVLKWFFGTLLLLQLLAAVYPLNLQAQDFGYRDKENEKVTASPKAPWGDFEVVDDNKASSPSSSGSSKPWWEHVLLWIPNRVVDFFDIFRVDVGAGPAIGGVLRLTKYAQVGYRQVAPFSLRVGDFGRKAPLLIETSNEFGIGPAYINSKDRKICNGEIGIGADLLLGAYVGFCSEQLLDFAAGLFFLDPSNDDIK